MAAITRHWSTYLNGIQTDEGKFRSEIGQLVTNMKKMMAGGAAPAPAKPMPVTDGKAALKEIEQSFGFAPDFLRRYPQEGLAGAWQEMRDLEMNPTTAIPGKYKSLIGLAVSAQIPCKFCIIADTEFAKLEGANDRELTEAVAMAGSDARVTEESVSFPDAPPRWKKYQEVFRETAPPAIVGPVKVAEGWRVAQVVAKDQAPEPLERLSSGIVETLRQQALEISRDRLFDARVAKLRTELKPTVYRERLRAVPWPVPSGATTSG